MKVVLLGDIKSLGKKDEIVNVSDGYARNYLLPRKLAKEATTGAVKEVNSRNEAEARRKALELEEAKKTAALINEKTVRITAKAGAEGKLFGAVTSKEISAAIKEQLGLDVDKKKIAVDDIKTFGTAEAAIKVYSGVSAKLYVMVTG